VKTKLNKKNANYCVIDVHILIIQFILLFKIYSSLKQINHFIMIILNITEHLLETGLFKNGEVDQMNVLKDIVIKFLITCLNFKIHNVPPLILHLIINYVTKSYMKLDAFFEDYLRFNKGKKIEKEIIFDDYCMLYNLSSIINGLKDETYIFKFNIKQQKHTNIYIGIETRYKWYYLNLKNNNIISNEKHDESFKLTLTRHQKITENDMFIFIKIDFNNIETKGLVFMKKENNDWLNTGLKFKKSEKTKIVFGCIETMTEDIMNKIPNTKVILMYAYKRINKSNNALYKNF